MLTESKEIGLGDVVTLACDAGRQIAWAHCTVFRVRSDGTVDIFRPYVHVADFSCGKEPTVITYIGHEEILSVSPTRLTLVDKYRG